MTFQLNLPNTALLVIDCQADAFNGNSYAAMGATEMLPRAKQVLAAARHAKLPIIHTREVHRKQGVDFGRELDGAESVHFLEHEAGTDFHPEFVPIEGEFAIVKRRYSSFFATDLEILLRGLNITTLILMGTLTNVCVHYTAVDAHQRDYHFYVIEDCCIGSDWEAHWAALRAMEYLQRNARISHQAFITATQQITVPARGFVR